jgi:hypothetical protein
MEINKVNAPDLADGELRELLISCIMELTPNERKELLLLWRKLRTE